MIKDKEYSHELYKVSNQIEKPALKIQEIIDQEHQILFW